MQFCVGRLKAVPTVQGLGWSRPRKNQKSLPSNAKHGFRLHIAPHDASTMSIPPRTPDSRTRPTLPITVFDTPHSRTSHFTSSGTSSAVHHQSTVESYLRDELSGSIQKHNTTFFNRLTDHVNSDKALTDCIHAASMESHAWPREKLGERQYYRPWTSMLNKFVTTF
jgi:hypothetical protein